MEVENQGEPLQFVGDSDVKAEVWHGHPAEGRYLPLPHAQTQSLIVLS